MALDKQRLLSELGSVYNQLQNADQGCMGKLFANPGQGYAAPNSGQGYAPNPGQGYTPLGNPLPTCGGCRRGTCPGHGYTVSRPGAGEPYPTNAYHMHGGRPPTNGMQGVPIPGTGMHGGVMSGTYNSPGSYNASGVGMPGNYMQGMPGGGMQGMPGGAMQGGGMQGGAMQGGGMQGYDMGNMIKNMMGEDNHAAPMGDMGAHIVNMMTSGGGGKPVNVPEGNGQLKDPMLIDAPHSPHGQIGVTPLTQPAGRGHMGHMGMSPGNAFSNQGYPNVGDMGQANSRAMMPPTQHPHQNPQETAITGNMPQNPGTQPLNYAVSNPAAQQMANSRQNQYGPHAASIKKFNEIFPGVAQGGLNFDPMAIAIQMNPANQQKTPVDTISKFLNNNKGLNSPMLKPVIAGASAASAAIDQSRAAPPKNQQLAPLAQQNVPPTGQIQQLQPASGLGSHPNQQVVYSTVSGAPKMNQPVSQQHIPQQSMSQHQALRQQVSQPHMLQQQMSQQQVPQQQMFKFEIDPNTRAGIIPEVDESDADLNAPVPQQPIKEPIFPVDTSNSYAREPMYTYNTLGQPVELFPVEYKRTTSSLPQTLGGSLRSDLRQGYDIKNTTSKTILAATRPAGKTASKSELQHIYRQYKGSHSATQQSIKRPPVQGGSPSEGRLTNTPVVVTPQIPFENVGGDTALNNQIINKPSGKFEPERGQAGDILATHAPRGDSRQYNEKIPAAIVQKRGRNGLQDQTYQPYTAAAAWTFHGTRKGFSFR